MKDIISYFTYLTGLDPTESQKEVLHDFEDVTKHKQIISAGRQSGKTLTTAVAICWWMFESGQHVNILLLSAQDNVLYYHIREIFKKHPELEEQLTEISKLTPNLIPLHGFELRNGNKVFVRGVTERNIRGIPADIVIIDEAALVPTNSILTALGNITGNIAKIGLLSTPDQQGKSKFNEWAEDGINGKGNWKLCMWSAEGLAWHDVTIEETKKSEMNAAQYAVEVLGRPPTKTERSFFNLKLLEEKIVTEREPLRQGGEKSTIEMGIDPSDECTAVVVTEKMGSKRAVLEAEPYHRVPREEVLVEILKMVRVYRPTIIKMDSKPPEIVSWYKSRLPYVKIIDASKGSEEVDEEGNIVWNNFKEQMMGQLRRRVNTNAIEISKVFVDLIIEMRRYKRHVGAENRNLNTRGSDLVDALALSCFEPPLSVGEHTSAYVPPPRQSRYPFFKRRRSA